jgi:hypothetical protein
MNPNKLNRAELADFAKNTATQVANGKVSRLLAAQVSSVSAAIDAAAAELAAADQIQVAARAAALEATRIAQEKRFALLKLLQDLKYTMKGIESGAHEFDAVGFDPPVVGRHIVTPQRPTELAATGFSNGVNELKFAGNNVPSSVTYVVEARAGDAARYTIIGTSRKQSFKHTGVRPGEPIQYRIRAQAARGMVSSWSNEAVVYGPLGDPARMAASPSDK